MDPRSTCLLLIDVINDFQFPAADRLLRYAIPAATRLAALKKKLKATGMPVIYVNDNFRDWHSDFKDQVKRCTQADCPGHPVARRLAPEPDDYFVLKPKHSGFYSTPLDVLLGCLGARTLVLAGFAADICVLYTANDAYMRDYELVIAADCTASEGAASHRAALEHMKERLKARVVTAGTIGRGA
jgi:nicotinamidase-related amidase